MQYIKNTQLNKFTEAYKNLFQANEFTEMPAKEAEPDDFETSDQFTSELLQISEIIKSPRWKKWMVDTDKTYGTQSRAALVALQKAVDALNAEIGKADMGG